MAPAEPRVRRGQPGSTTPLDSAHRVGGLCLARDPNAAPGRGFAAQSVFGVGVTALHPLPLPSRRAGGSRRAQSPAQMAARTEGPWQHHAISFDRRANKSRARWFSPLPALQRRNPALPAPDLGSLCRACPGCLHNTRCGGFPPGRVAGEGADPPRAGWKHPAGSQPTQGTAWGAYTPRPPARG